MREGRWGGEAEGVSTTSEGEAGPMLWHQAKSKPNPDWVCEKEAVAEEGGLRDALEGVAYIQATWYHKLVFFLLGFADLFFWNCVLDILYDIRENVYPEYPKMTDTLNAVNNVSTLVVALYTIRTGAMNISLTTISGGLLAAACLLTAVTVQWIPGKAGVVLLHLANVIAGACSGFFQTGSFALASVVGANGGLGEWISGGQGGCGLVTFLIWTLLSSSPLAVRPRLWILMLVGASVTVVVSIVFHVMCGQPDVLKRIRQVQLALRREAVNPSAPSYLDIFKRTWPACLSAFWCMYITLFFFPNIGPLNWGEGDFTNYTLGMFQVGDLVGRYLPALVPATLLSLPVAAGAVALRTVLLPLAILTFAYDDRAFWGNKAYHVLLMLVLSTSNGLIMSSLYVRGPARLPQENWRSRASSLIVLCLLAGISGGLWSARIFTAIYV